MQRGISVFLETAKQFAQIEGKNHSYYLSCMRFIHKIKSAFYESFSKGGEENLNFEPSHIMTTIKHPSHYAGHMQKLALMESIGQRRNLEKIIIKTNEACMKV
ncbi:hypothetical protein CX649_07440 [Bacillaceae bacterium ZC4]|jgi:hypothetical protein|uniref:Uncharacterized protein n=1 Tax=Aeribacillus pallidus TaxID=33936 RepID=A0A165Z5X0_9BACI|nr:hypothetical protein CX649_07440 [Bacillaceae bacterium ZC4]KZN97882.1 hypothetical protein AZI98_00730 [Aeribacillus pallidus]